MVRFTAVDYVPFDARGRKRPAWRSNLLVSEKNTRAGELHIIVLTRRAYEPVVKKYHLSSRVKRYVTYDKYISDWLKNKRMRIL